MIFTQKYCIAHFLTPLPDNFTFHASDWPPHCTLAGVFALDWTAEYRAEFRTLVKSQREARSLVADEDLFGPDHSIHVKLIEPVAPLNSLHLAIIDFIESRGGTLNEPNYTRTGFKPHITQLIDTLLPDDTPIVISSLSLIDMFPDADHTIRRTLETIALK